MNSQKDQASAYEFISTTLNELNQIPFAEVLRKANLTRESVYYINEILNVSSDFDLGTTLKILQNLQYNILGSDMTSEEKQYPLSAVSVAISSVSYWIEQINDTRSPWIIFVGDPLEFQWPWKKDAEGAIAGAIGGMIAGSPLFGGPGILLGGLGGMIGGAIGASVASALIKE